MRTAVDLTNLCKEITDWIRGSSCLMAICFAGLTSLLGAQAVDTPQTGMWVTNGFVTDVAVSGEKVYIGGSFTYVGPDTGYGVQLDTTTAEVAAGFPYVDGIVEAVASDGAGGWYIGGTFSQVGGLGRNGIAHILSDGSVNPTWNPNADSRVRALAVDGPVLFVGGSFNNIGGQNRENIAAIDRTTGNATGWNPGSDSTVRALVVSGPTLYVGGIFSTIAGVPRIGLAALNIATGTATPWNPSANLNQVYALAVSGTTVYAGGFFQVMGGENRRHLAAIAPDGTATAWDPNPDNSINAIAISGSTVYVGGAFNNIGGANREFIAAINADGIATAWNPNADGTIRALQVSGDTVYAGGLFTSIGGQLRNHIAAIDTAGNATAWDPHAIFWVNALSISGSAIYVGGNFSSINGKTRNRLAAFDEASNVLTDWDPNASSTVNALVVSDSTVYVGGAFTLVGGQPRNYLAALDPETGASTAWDPDADDTVHALTVSGSTVYVGGDFSNVGGANRNRIAALDANTDTNNATAWNPNADGGNVLTIVVSDSTVYVGGGFTSIGGANRNRIAALDANTNSNNATPWNPDASASVRTIAVSDSAIYAGGFFTLIGGVPRNRIAALDPDTGASTAWNPDADLAVQTLLLSGTVLFTGGDFSTIGGENRNRMAAIDTFTGDATAWNPNVTDGFGAYAMALSDSAIYVGGGFHRIGEVAQRGIAAFTLSDSDGDGVPDLVEDGAPNNGDGNNDGIPDRLQSYVTSLPAPNESYVTLVVDEAHAMRQVRIDDLPSEDFPPGVDSLPIGLISLEIHRMDFGQTVELTMLLADEPDAPLTGVYKSLVSLTAATFPDWTDYSANGNYDAVNRVLTVALTDGGLGDIDGLANGIIVDPLAPVSTGGPLLAEIESFSARSAGVGHTVDIEWSTSSEIDNVGFHLERVRKESGVIVAAGRVNGALIPGAGTAMDGASYSFTDSLPFGDGEQRGYFLVDIDANGNATSHGPFPVLISDSDPSGEREWMLY